MTFQLQTDKEPLQFRILSGASDDVTATLFIRAAAHFHFFYVSEGNKIPFRFRRITVREQRPGYGERTEGRARRISILFPNNLDRSIHGRSRIPESVTSPFGQRISVTSGVQNRPPLSPSLMSLTSENNTKTINHSLFPMPPHVADKLFRQKLTGAACQKPGRRRR